MKVDGFVDERPTPYTLLGCPVWVSSALSGNQLLRKQTETMGAPTYYISWERLSRILEDRTIFEDRSVVSWR